MGEKFYGYAAFYGIPTADGDIFLPGCFSEFLLNTPAEKIALNNGHNGDRVGRWIELIDDQLGLFVIGEMDDGFALPVGAGLSVTPVNSKGPPLSTPQGGRYCRLTELAEIALVEKAKQPLARVCGEWKWK